MGVALLVIAGGSYALYTFLQPQPLPEAVLYGNGHIEGSEVHVAAEVGGRVVDSRLVEGERVEVGAFLVSVDRADAVLQRDRAVAEIEALRRARERGDKELSVARHHFKMAERDLERYRELRKRDAIAPQRLEQAQDAFQEAGGRVAVLAADIGAFDARIDAAQKELGLMERRLAKTRIFAPITGTVLAKATEVGEYVQPGQTVAVLMDLSRLELKIFVPERDIGKVRLGGTTRVRVDAFPDTLFDGAVARVDQQAQFTPRDIHMPQERTRMVFGVTIALANVDGVLKPGMPADAWILWQADGVWPERLSVPE
ncbi:HlyD family secretion protein [Microbaculum sp. FT89]|uniref:HlyD family secretion protein n=1 Tax=Microbaculum sp. FT89 TaxID=3447298 RepID=UPI003F52CD27